MARVYSVTIYYRESTYERRSKAGPRPFRCRFEVEAEDRDLAMASARRRFDWIATQSTVEWTREVVGIECEV